ncbi:MAG TPA: heme exporter protein CcmD [Xanthobacteraceae bacterium]|nr:heme exporter protein CcmD [Xanthobacteraceae bacterium]
MNLGTYAGFILAAYAAALAVILLLIGWVVADYRAQRRALAELERGSDSAARRAP